MKVIKTEIRFKTGFQQPKTGFPKNPVLTSLILTYTFCLISKTKFKFSSCQIYLPILIQPVLIKSILST